MLELDIQPVHEGVVVSGHQLGRTIDVPTANIAAEDFEASNGVFAVKVDVLDSAHFGIANLGTRPTVNGEARLLEVHVFDFNQDLYGSRLRVTLLARVRDEIRFDSVEKMKTQIYHDIALVREFVEAYSDA